MKKLYLVVFLVSISSFVFSQNEKQTFTPNFGFIYSEGTLFCDFSNFNSTLETNHINRIENSIQSSTFGIYFSTKDNSSYSCLQLGLLESLNDNKVENIDPDFKGWDLNISYNYNLLRKRPATLLYPKIGFGSAFYQLNMVNNSYNINSFPQILDSLYGEKSFKSNAIFYTDLGVGFEKRIRILYINFFIGLDLSYVINFNKLKWTTIQGIEVSSMPVVKTNGLKLNFIGRFEIDWERYKNRKNKNVDKSKNSNI